MEYFDFKDIKIDINKAKENYFFWESSMKIPKVFNEHFNDVLEKVSKIHGAHTFAARAGTSQEILYPLLKIFSYNSLSKKFEYYKGYTLKADSILKGSGAHVKTARELGLNRFIFSYLGMHLPYHREIDVPPVCPFGLFLEVLDFAYLHGSPCDRDYVKNDEVDKENIDKYFLTPKDLQKVVTHRILTDEIFKNDFWNYYGNPEIWKDDDYRRNQWKKKGEYCYYEGVKPDNIKAILWPVWEEIAINDSMLHDRFFDLMSDFKDTFDIHVIIYRPYREIINKENWNNYNLRDWEIALVEASYLAQKYYDEFGFFPDSIMEAKEYFKYK